MAARSSVAAAHETLACPATVLVATGVPGALGATVSGVPWVSMRTQSMSPTK